MSRIDGKIVIITGGTQGVGESCAVLAAEKGAAGIVVCGRNEEKGNIVAEKITSLGTKGIYIKVDLVNENDCRNLVKKCDDIFGRVDGLVNAAADAHRGTVEETTVKFWDYQFAVNVRAPFILTQESVRVMIRERIAGSIVNILSAAGYCGAENLCSYSSTKGALKTLTKNNARALRKYKIRVNGINLGWTDTPNEDLYQIAQGSSKNWLEKAESSSPFSRLVKPLDVARLVNYLLSKDSGVLTGSCIDYSQQVIGV